MQKILLIGNAGTIPKRTEKGVSFSLAENNNYSKEKETTWYNIWCNNNLAEHVLKFVTKGMKIYVEGRLKSKIYKSNSGEFKIGNTLFAANIVFLNSSQESKGHEIGFLKSSVARKTASTEDRYNLLLFKDYLNQVDQKGS